MYFHVSHYAQNFPECGTVSGGGRVNRRPLHPIPVQRPFQIVGVDIMELPMTTRGNKLVLVFLKSGQWCIQCLTRRPFAFARSTSKKVNPFFGVPKSLLLDRGTNLLSHLLLHVCQLLRVKKLNTAAYYPQCNGMVKHFNRTC